MSETPAPIQRELARERALRSQVERADAVILAARIGYRPGLPPRRGSSQGST